MIKQVYLILAVLMLLCLAPMPYGYYMLVRFVAMVAFGLLSYQYYTRHKSIATIVFGVLSLLFQPIYKIALGRVTWNVIDVFVAVLLIALYVMEKRLEKKTTVGYQQLPPQDQIKLEDNQIEFALNGRLSPKELVYVASEEDKALTELLELSEISIGNDFLLQYLENPSDKEKIKQGFIRTEDIHRGNDGKDKAINRFYPLSSKSGEPMADQLHRIGKQISLEKGQHDRCLEAQTQSFDDWGDAESPSANFADDSFSAEEQEETINKLMEEIRERINKLRQRGVAEYERRHRHRLGVYHDAVLLL